MVLWVLKGARRVGCQGIPIEPDLLVEPRDIVSPDPEKPLAYAQGGSACHTTTLPALVRTPTLMMQPSLDIKPFMSFPVDSSSAVGLFPNFNTEFITNMFHFKQNLRTSGKLKAWFPCPWSHSAPSVGMHCQQLASVLPAPSQRCTSNRYLNAAGFCKFRYSAMFYGSLLSTFEMSYMLCLFLRAY